MSEQPRTQRDAQSPEDLWPDKRVDWNQPRDIRLVEELRGLVDTSADESPLQQFFTTHPYLLALAFPAHSFWVFPKPRFEGGTHIPDFLVCDRNSLGYMWTIVELESPTMKAINKNGSISHACQHAIEQVQDYRRFVRDNAMLLRDRGFKELDGDCVGRVVIGRRETDRLEIGRQRLRDFRRDRIEVMSYDRVVKEIEDHLIHVNNSRCSSGL